MQIQNEEQVVWNLKLILAKDGWDENLTRTKHSGTVDTSTSLSMTRARTHTHHTHQMKVVLGLKPYVSNRLYIRISEPSKIMEQIIIHSDKMKKSTKQIVIFAFISFVLFCFVSII